MTEKPCIKFQPIAMTESLNMSRRSCLWEFLVQNLPFMNREMWLKEIGWLSHDLMASQSEFELGLQPRFFHAWSS